MSFPDLPGQSRPFLNISSINLCCQQYTLRFLANWVKVRPARLSPSRCPLNPGPTRQSRWGSVFLELANLIRLGVRLRHIPIIHEARLGMKCRPPRTMARGPGLTGSLNQYAGIAQVVERVLAKHEVAGSTPDCPLHLRP